jgi:ketosteroid isomerase-like protein
LVPSLGEFPWGGEFKGRAAFRERLIGLEKHLTIDQFDQLHFLVDGDIVAVVSRIGSTLKKNGKSMQDVEFVQLLSFDQRGKCVRIAEFYDPTESLELWRT